MKDPRMREEKNVLRDNILRATNTNASFAHIALFLLRLIPRPASPTPPTPETAFCSYRQRKNVRLLDSDRRFIFFCKDFLNFSPSNKIPLPPLN